jgi:effector-binding domain-containing protein
MNILKQTVMAIAVLIGVLAVIGLFLPQTVHVERQRLIDAPASVVYAQYADLRRFNTWSPWALDDPEISFVFDGPIRGRGQIMHWSGPTAGDGSQTITLAEPYSRVEVALDFGPQGTATSAFQLTPEGQGTLVNWGFDTDFGYDLFGRYLGLLMDKWVGGDYERGLENLASVVAELPRTDFATLDHQFAEVAPVLVASAAGQSVLDDDAMKAALNAAWAEVDRFIAVSELSEVGPRMTITTSHDPDQNLYSFDAAIPIDRVPRLRDTTESSNVRVGETYSGRVLQVVHQGSYQGLGMTYAMATSLLASYGLEVTDRSFEEYRNGPAETPEVELLTVIYFPLD